MAGAALLLFRCSLALFIATTASDLFPTGRWPSLPIALLAAAVASGLYTRLLAALSVFAGVALLIGGECKMPTLLITQMIDAAAVVLIGPGAFSIDARMFGRATITLPR